MDAGRRRLQLRLLVLRGAGEAEVTIWPSALETCFCAGANAAVKLSESAKASANVLRETYMSMGLGEWIREPAEYLG